MPWEKRKGRGRYYVRAYKDGGKIIREYIGMGPVAEAVAQAGAEAREVRLELEAAQRQARERARDLERQLNALCRLADDLVGEELRAAGYHQHARGAWRKKRVTTIKTIEKACGGGEGDSEAIARAGRAGSNG